MMASNYERWVHEVQWAEDESTRRAAFDRLVEHFAERAEHWATEGLRDKSAAQDAVQEAFMIAYRQISTLRDPSAFPGWLRQIVRSQSARITRRRDHHWLPLDDDSDRHTDPNGDPDAEYEQGEITRELRRALDHLNDGERRVTELFYLDELSQGEIAERLALPLTTVKKRLQYAREHLRKSITASVSTQMALLRVGGIAGSEDALIRWWLSGTASRRLIGLHKSDDRVVLG